MKVVKQVWNVKISKSEFNGTMIGIILGLIADPWGWFEFPNKEICVMELLEA